MDSMVSHTRAVVLEIDGTLLDSIHAHALAWKRSLDDEGIRNSVEEIERWIGIGTAELVARLVGVEQYSLRGRIVTAKKEKIYREEFLPRVQAFAGSRELLVRMRNAGLHVMLAGSFPEGGLLNITDLIEPNIPGGRSLERAIKSFLEEYGMRPNEIILLGHSHFHLAAARNFGISMVSVRSNVALTNGHIDPTLATVIANYENVDEILKKFEESPFFCAGVSGGLGHLAA